jgi:hypothetical protein
MLIQRATNSYLSGDLHAWYWTLTAIREQINYNLNETERILMDAMENECLKVEHRNKNQFTIKVREYQRKIMDLLKETGFLPPKKDNTRLGF